MTHRRLVWLVSLPLVTVGSLAAHLAAHRLLAPPAAGSHAHHHVAAAPAHWRTCFVICGAVLAGALAVLAFESLRRGRPIAPPILLAGIVPPVGFALADAVGSGSLPLVALLQLPVLALFVFLARRLASGAAALGRALRAAPRPPGRAPAVLLAGAASAPRRVLLGLPRGRAPPLPAPA